MAVEPPRFDLVIAHGRVLDASSGRDGVFDVGILDGRVAAIAATLDVTGAKRVVEARGLYVTAGFVDLHTHVFFGPDAKRYLSGSPLAVRADDLGPSSCTTTVVDAGSSGHNTFARFHDEIIAPATTRVLAFVNIVGEGMRGGRFEQDVSDMDAAATARIIEAHRSEIVGIKVAHYSAGDWVPIDRAVTAARATGTRVMIDFGGHVPELPLDELLLKRLGAGDIYTHMYADVRGRASIVDDRGVLRPYVRAARARGILFDLGYGGASFVFSQAEPAIAQGFPPDTISTDAHRASRGGTMHDIVQTLSKLAALGMTLPDLIRRATLAPAQAIARADLGRLVEGAEADVAVLSEEVRGEGQERFDFEDVKHHRLSGALELQCELTVRAGRIVWDPRSRAR